MIVALLLAACAPDHCVEPVRDEEPAAGDANGDGAVDLADGIYLQRWLLRGGPEPVCAARMDVVPNGTLDVADSLLIWSHVYAGQALAAIELPCGDRAAAHDTFACGASTLAIDAPASANGAFDATITLATPDVEIEGWQFGVRAEGCTVTSATLAGTRSADVRDGGSRSTGYARADAVDGGVVSAVALSWIEERVLDASAEAYPLLSIHVEASPPSSGCTPCTLTFDDTLAGAGQPVRTMVARKGRAVLPDRKNRTVQICAG